MKATVEIKAVLYGVAPLEAGRAVHLTDVVAAPTLDQHQEVGGAAVGLVVGLEIVFRPVDVAAKV